MQATPVTRWTFAADFGGDGEAGAIYDSGGKYAYSPPAVGNNLEVTVSPQPKKYKAVAHIHSHGRYRSGYRGDYLEGHDVDQANAEKITVYVTTPKGALLKNDPGTAVGGDNWVNVFLPSDPGDPYALIQLTPLACRKMNQRGGGLIGRIIFGNDNNSTNLMKQFSPEYSLAFSFQQLQS